MIVEDNKLVRGLVRKILDEQGYRVLEAGDGQEAQVIYMQENGRIDLVLSDVVLPQMGGVELVRRLRHSNPELRVIFMSGYNKEEQVEEDHPDFFRQYLPKPFTREILLQKVRQVLNQAD